MINLNHLVCDAMTYIVVAKRIKLFGIKRVNLMFSCVCTHPTNHRMIHFYICTNNWALTETCRTKNKSCVMWGNIELAHH
jgi:hypothetical protein